MIDRLMFAAGAAVFGTVAAWLIHSLLLTVNVTFHNVGV